MILITEILYPFPVALAKSRNLLFIFIETPTLIKVSPFPLNSKKYKPQGLCQLSGFLYQPVSVSEHNLHPAPLK